MTTIRWVKIDDGETFEGSISMFRDCFFDNASEESIADWCDEQGYKLEISNRSIEEVKQWNEDVLKIQKFFEDKGFYINTDKDSLNENTHFIGTKKLSNDYEYYVFVRYNPAINSNSFCVSLENDQSNSRYTIYQSEFNVTTFEQFLLDYKEFHLKYLFNCLINMLTIVNDEIEGEKDETTETI